MFGIGGTELIVIAVVLLIAVGPNRLPKLLKAVASAYREFRRATRELRASTGIDELLQDEDLRDLRKPLYVPPAKPKPAAAPAKPRRRSLSYAERIEEDPPEGVDLAAIREAERRAGDPPGSDEDAVLRAEEAEVLRAEEAEVLRAEEAQAARIRAAKRTAAPESAAGNVDEVAEHATGEE